MKYSILKSLASLAASVIVGNAQAALYSIVDIGFLPGGSAYSIGAQLSNNGTVIGYGDSALGQRSFVWANGVMNDFGSLPNGISGGGGTVQGISGDGKTIVGTGDNGAFSWTTGARTDLGYFPSPLASSVATAVNDSGQIVGWGYAGQKYVNGWLLSSFHAWLWQNNNFVDLGTLGGPQSSPYAINNNGVIVGWSQPDPVGQFQHAFIWENGVMTNLGSLGPTSAFVSMAIDVNNSNVVVGRAQSAQLSGSVGVVWDHGKMLVLPTFGFAPTEYYAVGINDDGLIVGNALNAVQSQRAVLWVNGEIKDLNDLVPTFDSAVVLKSAMDINESGQILALGNNMHSYLLTPIATVPEPESLALFGLALAGLGLTRRKAWQAVSGSNRK